MKSAEQLYAYYHQKYVQEYPPGPNNVEYVHEGIRNFDFPRDRHFDRD